MQQIDQLDKNILFMLSLNSRQSVKQIARRLKMKQDTVAYRIKQLEKAGVISGYFTVIDYAQLGYSLVRLYLKLQSTTPALETEIINALVSEHSMLTVYKTEGDWDIVIGFLASDLESFTSWYTTFLLKYKPYIFRDNKALFLEYIHYPKNYLVKKELYAHHSLSIGKATALSLNKIDASLLRLIAKDAHFSLLSLAKELKLTPMAVHYRLKMLEKRKIILGYSAFIDISKLGYNYYKIDLDINDLKSCSKILEFLAAHPNVVYVDKTFGGSDVEFDVELQNQEAFYTFLNQLKEKFPHMIRTYHYYRAQRIYKYEYLPKI